MKKNRAIIFDLDETLIDEKKYRLNLLQKISKFVEYKNKSFIENKIKNFNRIKKKIYNFRLLTYFSKKFLKRKKISQLKYIYYSSTHVPLYKNTIKTENPLKVCM